VKHQREAENLTPDASKLEGSFNRRLAPVNELIEETFGPESG